MLVMLMHQAQILGQSDNLNISIIEQMTVVFDALSSLVMFLQVDMSLAKQLEMLVAELLAVSGFVWSSDIVIIADS